MHAIDPNMHQGFKKHADAAERCFAKTTSLMNSSYLNRNYCLLLSPVARIALSRLWLVPTAHRHDRSERRLFHRGHNASTSGEVTFGRSHFREKSHDVVFAALARRKTPQNYLGVAEHGLQNEASESDARCCESDALSS